MYGELLDCFQIGAGRALEVSCAAGVSANVRSFLPLLLSLFLMEDTVVNVRPKLLKEV